MALVDNLIAHWKMNDDAADAIVADATGNGHTGTFYDENTPATITSDHSVTGKVNDALDFDGTNDYITAADSDDFTYIGAPFSVAAWINIGVGGAAEFEIISKYQTGQAEWALYLSGDALYFVFWDNTNGGNSGRIDTADYSLYEDSGIWLFVVATYDGTGSGTGIKLYLDGVQCDDSAESNGSYTAMENTTSSLYMGMRHDSPNKVTGQIDNVMLFDTELTQAQINTLYNSGDGTESISATAGELTIAPRRNDGLRARYEV